MLGGRAEFNADSPMRRVGGKMKSVNNRRPKHVVMEAGLVALYMGRGGVARMPRQRLRMENPMRNRQFVA